MREWRRTTGSWSAGAWRKSALPIRAPDRAPAQCARARAAHRDRGPQCGGSSTAQRATAAARARSSACACNAPARAPPASRWPATDGNTACTSSGSTIGRPRQSAHARAAASSIRPARGRQPAPRAGVAVGAAADVAARRREQRLHVVEQRRRDVDRRRLRAASRPASPGRRAAAASAICARRSPPDEELALGGGIRDSRARSPSGSGRAAIRAADRRRSARPDSAWR